MSDRPPFGFSADDSDRPGGDSGASGFDMSQFGSMLENVGRMMQHSGDGPVHWELARDTARKAVAEVGDPSPSSTDERVLDEAVRLAEVWLDSATTLPAGAGQIHVWSRSAWIEATLPAWQQLVGPIAAHVQGAMSSSLPQGDLSGGDANALLAQLPPEIRDSMPADLSSMLAPMMGMARQMGATMFGMQLGQGLAELSGDVFGACDIGVPLTSDGRPALLPANIQTFGSGIGVPLDQVRVYLAMRECAHQRLFAHVPWLRARLNGAIEEYANGIHIDMSRIQEAAGGLDPSNPESISQALASGVFEPEDSPQQTAALHRLETLLALVEGWVDHVVHAAARDRLPSADALRESLRRRRAAGGPAEKTFAELVGMELRPRGLREASALFNSLEAAGGAERRDGVWEHPDLLPSADDLDDPAAYVERSAPLDLSTLNDSPAPIPSEDPDTDKNEPDAD